MSRKTDVSRASVKSRVADLVKPYTLDIPGLDSDDIDKRILLLKQEKTKGKTAFTKLKNKLVSLLEIEDEQPSRTLVREMQECLVNAQEKALMIMDRLSKEYHEKKEEGLMQTITSEMELMDNELAGANRRAQEYLDSRQGEPSSVASSVISQKLANIQKKEVLARKEAEKVRAIVNQKEAEFALRKKQMQIDHEEQIRRMELIMLEEQNRLQAAEEELARQHNELENTMDHELGLKTVKPNIKIKTEFGSDDTPKSKSEDVQLGHDMWKQLERVTIPVFAGNKAEYESWKSAFMSCVDAAPATPQYKL